MWPYCDGVYETMMPIVVNATVLNPMSVAGRFDPASVLEFLFYDPLTHI
jgi:hypothetical protein